MKQALKQLVDELDDVAEAYEEVGDTAVRESMSEAVRQLLFVPTSGYVLPGEFGMCSDAGDLAVRRALDRFLSHPESVALASCSLSATERLAAFQDEAVQSAKGSFYDDYFGYGRSI